MRGRPFPLLCSLLSAACTTPVWAQNPLDFNGRPPDSILITWSDQPPDHVFDRSEMANRLLGMAGRLDPTDSRKLWVASRNAPTVGWPEELEPLGALHASRADDTRSLRFAVTGDGVPLLADIADPRGVYELPAHAADAIEHALHAYAGDFASDAEFPVAEVFTLPQPYLPSPIILDAAAVRERINGGHKTALDGTDRYLPEETLHARLPAGYDPRSPAGMLVWVSAMPDGRPPAELHPAADRLGLITIGAADSGNTRFVTDRYQLALDAVATARRRFHIDDARVYIAGLSGGGRVASTLAGCFPEVFTGAAPIVGISAYEHVPLGDGRFIGANFARPKGELWRFFREHPMAAITGQLDFNYREIVNAARLMQKDGVNVRLFEYEDMAHTLPTPDRFVEAMLWVDEPAHSRRDKGWGEAASLLQGYEAKFADVPVTTDAQRRLLEEVTVAGPWSPAAWRACEILNLVSPAPTDPPRP